MTMGTRQSSLKKIINLLLLMLPWNSFLYADSEKVASSVATENDTKESISETEELSSEGTIQHPPFYMMYRFEFSYDASGNCVSRTYVPYEPELPPIIIEPDVPFEP